MYVEGTDPKTGEKVGVEAPGFTSELLDAIAEMDVSDERIRAVIDQLNISADMKSALYTLSKVTMRAGQAVVKLGRKIVDIVVKLFEAYPNAGFGAIFGAIVGFLISTIPFIGQIIGPIVTPLLIGFGILVGALGDISNKGLAREIAAANHQFSTLGA